MSSSSVVPKSFALLTVRNPWAYLIQKGYKKIENRSKDLETEYLNKWIALHVSKTFKQTEQNYALKYLKIHNSNSNDNDLNELIINELIPQLGAIVGFIRINKMVSSSNGNLIDNIYCNKPRIAQSHWNISSIISLNKNEYLRARGQLKCKPIIDKQLNNLLHDILTQKLNNNNNDNNDDIDIGVVPSSFTFEIPSFDDNDDAKKNKNNNDIDDDKVLCTNKPLKRKRKRKIIVSSDDDDDIKTSPNINIPNKKRKRNEFEFDIQNEEELQFFQSIDDIANDIDKYETDNNNNNNHDQSRLKCQEYNCNSISIDSGYFKHFGIYVCRECKWSDKYKCITKTKAKKEYLLSDGDIKSLKCWIKDIKYKNNNNNNNNIGYNVLSNMNNNSSSAWIPKYMKLYLKYQLQELSLEKWGSIEGIEGERNRREVNKMQRSITNARKKRKNTFECLNDIEISPKIRQQQKDKVHIHEFDDPVCIDDNNDEWSKTCIQCGYVETWEEF